MRRWTSNPWGDISGGFTAAVLAIPVSMGYGILALSPLGDQYLPHAVLAGLVSAIIVPIVALAVGADTAIVYGPRSIVTFLIGSIVLQQIVRSGSDIVRLADPHRMLALVFLMVLVAGLLQAVFGLFRLGGLVQYIPSPVMAGFQNAAAILIFLSQVDAMFGFPKRVPPLQILGHLGEARWLTLAVGIVTALGTLYGPKLTRRLPAPITGLLVGCGVHHLFSALGYGDRLGSVVGQLPSAVPTPAYAGTFFDLLTTPAAWPLLPGLLSGADSLAVIGSLDALLCAKTVEAITGDRVRGNRELFRLGVGNAAAACFGAISSGVNLGSSTANYRGGGRTPASVLVSALVILLTVLLFAPVIAYIPRAVIAGLLTVVAIQLIDPWTIQIVRRLLSGDLLYWQTLITDLFVIALVASVAIAVNLVLAVAIGVAVAIASFLMTMSKSVVRRAYHGDAVHSHRTRDPGLMELLATRGRRIVVFELEGPIFFGTAEDLARRVDTAMGEDVAYVVLDLKRVNEIDSTGARILIKIHRTLALAGKHLVIGYQGNHRLARFLGHMGVTAALTPEKIFADTDGALEWAEDRLIASERGELSADDELPLARMEILAGLTDAERETLGAMLERREYGKGEVVFPEGDESRDLFLIARGTASVTIRLPGQDRSSRVATFSPGTVFGELALLDRQPRSATVEADDKLLCWVLTWSAFETIAREHRPIAIKLLTNLGRELSQRLRRANRAIRQLES